MRISIFAPFGALDHQTGILNAVRAFARADFDVDVYTIRNLHHQEPRIDSARVKIHFMPWKFAREREPRELVTLLFSIWILSSFWRRHRVIFAGGLRGLFAAWIYSWFRRTHIVNYQMELYLLPAGGNAVPGLFKRLERKAAQASLVSIEHSEERKALLAADLCLPPESIVVVPNSPLGPARAHVSSLLHDRLGIARDVRLVVFPGTLSEEFLASGVVRAAAGLPSGWVCVLHSNVQRDAKDPYLLELNALATGAPVRLSLEPVSYGAIDDLMGSARIGLAVYSSDAGLNWSTVGLASGKLSHFLRVGVPVIVSNSPGLAEFVAETGAGEVIADLSGLASAVARIEGAWEEYSHRALQAFDRYLAFERNFDPVVQRCRKWGGTGE